MVSSAAWNPEHQDGRAKAWYVLLLIFIAQDCNDQSEEAETYEPSPTKNRFRHNNENANRLFTNEIEEFWHNEASIENGIVSIEVQKAFDCSPNKNE